MGAGASTDYSTRGRKNKYPAPVKDGPGAVVFAVRENTKRVRTNLPHLLR